MASKQDTKAISKPHIVPHAKGTDIAAYCYGNQVGLLIFRSDLGYYSNSRGEYTKFTEEPEILPIPTGMENGDHYFSSSSEPDSRDLYVYVIKGENVYKTNMDDSQRPPKKAKLHPNCRGGSHYMSYNGRNGKEHFVIIFQSRGMFRVVQDLASDKNAKECKLHDNCKNGIYYFAYCVEDLSVPMIHILDQVDEEYPRVTLHPTYDLENDGGFDFLEERYSYFPEELVSFLPGGTSISIGIASSKWAFVTALDNQSEKRAAKVVKKVSMKFGYNKSVAETIGMNMGISTKVGVSIPIQVVKAEVSITASFGMNSSSTSQEQWNEEHTVEETLEYTVPAQSSVYVWQKVVSMGEKTVFSGKSLKFTSTKIPPTD